MNLLGFIMSLVYMQAVHGWLSAYERLVNSQNFFSPYLTQEDMSRIGRDYLQVGFYTEIMFKEKEVHFIAIANGVDNQKRESSEFAPFLNIMNITDISGMRLCTCKSSCRINCSIGSDLMIDIYPFRNGWV